MSTENRWNTTPVPARTLASRRDTVFTLGRDRGCSALSECAKPSLDDPAGKPILDVLVGARADQSGVLPVEAMESPVLKSKGVVEVCTLRARVCRPGSTLIVTGRLGIVTSVLGLFGGVRVLVEGNLSLAFEKQPV